MKDYISRQAAIDTSEKFIKDCNPEHFEGQQKFIEYMDDDEIGSFGRWQFANGFNMGLTAAQVAIKQLPFADVVEVVMCKDCKKHNIAMGDHLDLGYNKYHWYEKSEVCPLIDMRGKAQGHEFDYQFCVYAERRTDE